MNLKTEQIDDPLLNFLVHATFFFAALTAWGVCIITFVVQLGNMPLEETKEPEPTYTITEKFENCRTGWGWASCYEIRKD